MIFPIAFFLGGAFGWFRATKRGGQTADKLQYGAAFGIVFTLATLFIMIFLSKISMG